MKNPWTIPNSPWKDEKAYLNWLRGSIRRIWSRHPVKVAYKQSRRYKAPVGRNGKEVFVSDCEVCGKQSRDCQVDHLHGGYGFTDWTSFTDWARMILWVGFDDIQEVCVECHEVINLIQRKGISFEQASYEKIAIDLIKKKLDKSWLESKGTVPASNQTKRREQIVDLLRKEKEIIALLKQPIEVQRAFLEAKGYSPIPKTKKGLKEAIERVIEEAR